MTKRSLLIGFFLLLLGGFTPVEAQERLILTSTSSKYPYQRGQWGPAECKAWQEKYEPIIGINHPEPPNSAMSRIESYRVAADLGYNSVRQWTGGTYAQDYINNLESALADAAACGMTFAPVFGFPQSFYGWEDKEAGLKALEGVVREIIRHFRGDDRIVLWDIWNEPEMHKVEDVKLQMEWIKKMAQWCREEGCTQAITASIVWDSGIASASENTTQMAYRKAAEAQMDLHNFHDYSVQETHSENVGVMVDRLKTIRDCPLVCTEAMIHTNGSGVVRSLSEFAKLHINFYTWGLHACDANWEVSWGRSTFYAWEPIFHNILFANGDAVDQRELDCIRTFRFVEPGESIDPGVENSERWTERRAWKWMNQEPIKGLRCESYDEAKAAISRHSGDRLYNCINVRLKYSDYTAGASSFKSKLTQLLKDADAAGMTVIPTLADESNLNSSIASTAKYIEDVINSFYQDRRIKGWNVVEQTAEANASTLNQKLKALFSYIRYSFPCQPIFATPRVDAAVTPDATKDDVANTMWKYSDVTAYTASTQLGQDWHRAAFTAYERPIFCLSTETIQEDFADMNVTWFATTEQEAETVAAYRHRPLTLLSSDERWPSWKAFAWVNGRVTKGLSATNINDAISKAQDQIGKNIYNSLHVVLSLSGYQSDKEDFFARFDELLTTAEQANMTILPSLINDNFAGRDNELLIGYVKEFVGRYANDPRIMAWDLFYRPGTSYTNSAKTMEVLPLLFEAAKSMRPIHPVMATPTVTVNTSGFPEDYVDALVHGHRNGWSRLSYGNRGSVEMCSLIWKLSDVISYTATQSSPYLGWLNSVAYKYGRPMLCIDWKPVNTEETSKSLDIFEDFHVGWYMNGTKVTDEEASAFNYRPIVTPH